MAITETGLPCPECGGRMAVTDSRQSNMMPSGSRADADPVAIRRRRRCDNCSHRITTYEVPAEMISELNPAQHVTIVRLEACLATAQELLASLRKPEVVITDAEFEEVGGD